MKAWYFNAIKPYLITISLLIVFFFSPLSTSAALSGIHALSKQGKRIYLYEDYHAFVIGVGNYDRWPKLPYAPDDAKQVAERLKMMGYQVRLILDPTARKLKDVFNEMVYTLGKAKDRAILLYYAGHGETETLADNTKMGYLIPKDCPLLKKNPVGFGSHAVSLREIESISLRIRSKHVLMLFDSCFSGSLFSLVRAVPEDITEKSNLPVRQYITAGREDEQVPDKSIFKRSFLVGLEGDADLTGDGYITGSELGMYLSDKVVNYTHGRQHPQYEKINNPHLDRGDYVFIPIIKVEKPKTDINTGKNGIKPIKKSNESIKIAKEDKKLDMLFWESIKDSNDCEMFNEYLKQFPSGRFSGLAQIYVRKLECESSGHKKALGEKANEGQTLASLPPKDDLKPAMKLSIAVFPWYFSSPMKVHKDSTIEVLGEIFSTSTKFETMYSYYEMGQNISAKRLREDIFSDDTRDDLWITKNLLSKEPNIKLIGKIGDNLSVDLVLLFGFRAQAYGSSRMTIYLVDVKKRVLHKETFTPSPYKTKWNIKSRTEDFLNQFSDLRTAKD